MYPQMPRGYAPPVQPVPMGMAPTLPQGYVGQPAIAGQQPVAGQQQPVAGQQQQRQQPNTGQPMQQQQQPMAAGQPMVYGQQMGYAQPVMMQPTPMMMPGQPMMMQPAPVMAPGQPMMMMPPGPTPPGQPVAFPMPAAPRVIPQANPNDPAILNSPFLQECPPGMQFLIPTSAIIVRQQVEWLEVLTGIETNNRYDILDVNGLRMYLAAERSDYFSRQCLGADRLFNITVLDNTGRACLNVNRTQSSMCFNCNGNEVQITTVDNRLVGVISQLECMHPRFSLQDDTGNERLQLCGPCTCTICGDVSFTVEENGNAIGEVHKQWGGYLMETYTKADTFGVSFPVNLHPRLKCLLLGAVFLIDFMYFEESNNNQGGGGRHHHHHHHHGFGHHSWDSFGHHSWGSHHSFGHHSFGHSSFGSHHSFGHHSF